LPSRKRTQPKGNSRPFIFFVTWLMSGRVSAAPRVSPSRSATKVQRGSRICFRFFAWNRTSSSVIGMKPQFFSQAEL
jgi:hypothetical protein